MVDMLRGWRSWVAQGFSPVNIKTCGPGGGKDLTDRDRGGIFAPEF